MSATKTTDSPSLIRVQRRVFAIGFFTVTIHGVLGLIGVAHVLVGQDRHSDAVALVFMSGVAAVLVYLGVRAILAKPFWSPAWIALALTPTAAAFIWVV
ncbi:hypothetical protein [Aeromicrobium terrae]|uniref:Uncharacterized protein n=1 Tax=Aeromicrobium terrae TaxID=2498846 RepID=A0A5C8NE51_9ACTN|nr:hypothetical protein [Aeromicrobium terrae]TXL56575.1 hypothetical protein FHP06_15660 [Aeromicrobium terrae]